MLTNYPITTIPGFAERHMTRESAAEWAILTVVHRGESVTVTNIDQLERRNIKEHGVTRPYDRTYSHKATKAAYSV
jgi:hypothetical protein